MVTDLYCPLTVDWKYNNMRQALEYHDFTFKINLETIAVIPAAEIAQNVVHIL